jgi:hypothetical protein
LKFIPRQQAPSWLTAVVSEEVKMTVPIITPEQRLSEPRGVRALIVGPYTVGKTSLARHLDSNTTLFIDVENGSLAIADLAIPHASADLARDQRPHRPRRRT